MRRPTSQLCGGNSIVDNDVVEQRHELRAALFALEATADVLRHRLDGRGADLGELSTALLVEIRRIQHMVSGTTASSATFDLAAAIAAVLTTARATGLTVLDRVPGTLTVVGDPDDAAQVVVDLLDNARRHAPASTVIVSAAVAPRQVSLIVEDAGPGLAADRDVFARGVRDPASAGDGLGLFIARRLMERHGGTLTAGTSTIGGASFAATFRRAS